jgi:uncharacterized protein YyaL (SSP411 family)
VTNRLSDATSPYLLQHADNPVDWWPWGDEAFAEAKRRDVPIFLSVGYAACHWCHVMAHESFENHAIAAQLNEDYVSVKVDREERPDVDAVYMAAVQGLTGHGGWPMTVFLNHERKPFHAGTYFPPTPHAGTPSFPQVLTAVSEAWVERRSEVDEGAAKITGSLIDQQERPALVAIATDDLRSRLEDATSLALQRLAHDFDPVSAGFGSAPKFPPSTVLAFLLRHWQRTGAVEALSLAENTCEAMARGGIYDQLAGGFARYSVDQHWVVPHFEKMLYDNTLLLRVYAQLYALTGSELARRVATETAEFLLRDLRTVEGGFASALDADAPKEPGGHAHEGTSYVWTPEQLVEVLGPQDGQLAAELFGVTPAGTFEDGSSVLQWRRDEWPTTGAGPGTSANSDEREELAPWRARVIPRMLARRDERPQPARDDKVVAAWNGLAIAALAEAGSVLSQPHWITAATSCAELLVSTHIRELPDGSARLLRVSKDGHVNPAAHGVLEDYGDVAEGLLTLATVTGEPRWISIAERLLATVIDQFSNPAGGFFDTAADAQALIVRPSDPTDLAAPGGWSAATNALLTYGSVMASERHLRAAEAGLQIVDQLARKAPRFAGWLLAATEAFVDGPWQVVIVGDPASTATQELRQAVISSNRVGLTVLVGHPDPTADTGPFADRPMVGDQPTAYICQGTLCHAPVTSPADASTLLASHEAVEPR